MAEFFWVGLTPPPFFCDLEVFFSYRGLKIERDSGSLCSEWTTGGFGRMVGLPVGRVGIDFQSLSTGWEQTTLAASDGGLLFL